MRSAMSGPNLWQIWQVFGPWASPYGANGQITMTVHNYRPRQFHRTSNGENPSSGYRDMGSASLAAARPAARPPARTVTTIPLQPEGLRGKKLRSFNNHMGYKISRSHSPEEFFIALAIGLLLKSNTFALTSRHHVWPCYVRILCLCHNTAYARWHVFLIPTFCKQCLSATLFGR